MKKMVVLAGPQAAGKTTCLNRVYHVLRELYPCFPGNKEIEPFVLQEARQVVVHKYHAMGAIFLTKEQEKEIIEIDFYRMERILSELDERLLYFDECNVFTLAHAKAHGVDLVDEYLPVYFDFLKRLQAVVIFLDITPEISWARRKSLYQSRLYRFPENERGDILDRYHQYLEALHPALNTTYEKIILPKIKIDADDQADTVVKRINSFLIAQQVI